jgi:Domain of unknown function (DUF4845)
MQHSPTQRGFSLLSVLFWVALLGSLLLVGMQVTPVAVEYMAVKRALSRAATAGEPPQIRSSFDDQTSATYIESITGRDLIIETANNISTVSFKYQKIIPLAGPVSLLFDLSGTELIR